MSNSRREELNSLINHLNQTISPENRLEELKKHSQLLSHVAVDPDVAKKLLELLPDERSRQALILDLNLLSMVVDNPDTTVAGLNVLLKQFYWKKWAELMKQTAIKSHPELYDAYIKSLQFNPALVDFLLYDAANDPTRAPADKLNHLNKSYEDAYKTLSECNSREFNQELFQDRYNNYFVGLIEDLLKAQKNEIMPEHEAVLWQEFEDEYRKSPNAVIVHLPTELVLMYIKKINPDFLKYASNFDLNLILGCAGRYRNELLARLPLAKAYELVRGNSMDVSVMRNIAIPYLATLPVAARMQELLKCRHSIKYAMKVPEVFKGILDLFPDHESRRALILNDKWNDSYYPRENLVDMAQEGYEIHPESLRMILAELTTTELQEKVNFSLILSDYPALFAVYFGMLNPDQQRGFLNYRDKLGNCALHYAASRARMFAPVLAQYERLFGKERIASELMLHNLEGESPLHIAEGHEDTIAIAWSYFPGKSFQVAMTPSRSGDTAINRANTKEAMLQVLGLYHPNMRIAALTSESHGRWLSNHNPMETASRSLDWLQAVLNMLPPHDQPRAMQAAGEPGIAALQTAADDADNMTYLLGLYPQEQRLDVLTKRCRYYGSGGSGNEKNLLMCMTKPAVITVVMDLLSPADQVKMLNADRVGYKAFIVEYAKENIAGCMEVIDHLKNDSDKLKLLRFENGMYFQGAEIFRYASGNLPILQKLFAIVPPSERLKALTASYDPNFPYTTDLSTRRLYNLAGCLSDHKSIKTIIGMLPPNQRLPALLSGRHDNQWYNVISYYERKDKLSELIDLFSILSTDDINEILTRKIDMGYDQRTRTHIQITLREAIKANQELRQQFVAMMQDRSIGNITSSQSGMYQPADDRSSDVVELLREVKKVRL